MSARWILDGFDDSLDLSETGGEFQVRHHYVFSRYKKVLASDNFNSKVSTASGTVDYYVGSKHVIKIISGRSGSPKYICVSDGISPEQPGTPGDYVVRRQVWEYYGAWEDPPDGWGQATATE